jgi:TPR repeat protein
MVSKTNREFDAGLAAYSEGNFSQALEHWLPLAELGHPDSQAWVAALHYNAEGVPLDYAAAAAWYRKAAEGGNVFAQNNLATMYIAGQGVEKNHGEAARWLMKAAEKLDPYAIFNLASLYERGDCVEKDPRKAADYYRSAAELGHVPSQSRLGYMYANGIGVPRNRVEAFIWLSLAAQHGIGSALVELESIVQAMSAEEKMEGQRVFNVRRGARQAAGEA